MSALFFNNDLICSSTKLLKYTYVYLCLLKLTYICLLLETTTLHGYYYSTDDSNVLLYLPKCLVNGYHGHSASDKRYNVLGCFYNNLGDSFPHLL